MSTNTDIRLQLSIRNHPKTKKLRLRLGPDGVLGLIWLMMFAAEARPDGDLVDMDAEDLALAADYPGDPDEFVEILVAVGYLDPIENGWRIHDWAENNPYAAGSRARSEKARKAALARWGTPDEQTKKQGLNGSDDAPSIRGAMPGASGSNAPDPSPSPDPDPLKGVLPQWLPAETWTKFAEHRVDIGEPLTEIAARRILVKLKRYAGEPYNVKPGEALQRSIEMEYRGVFPEQIVRERNDTNRRQGRGGSGSAASRRAQEADAVRARLENS